jgi:redox-sensitive bicupin YhaK (pirin superfamily)
VKEIVTDPQYLDVAMPAGTTFTRPVPPEHTVFATLFEGVPLPAGATRKDRRRERRPLRARRGGDGGNRIAPARFLLVSGRPLREPVAWRGPIVSEQRRRAQEGFDELRAGTFVKRR